MTVSHLGHAPYASVTKGAKVGSNYLPPRTKQGDLFIKVRS